MPESDTIHYSRIDIIHTPRHYSLYNTNNTHNTQKHSETLPQSTYTNSTILELHTHQNTNTQTQTQNTNTLIKVVPH